MATKPRDEINSQLQANQERLRQDNTAQMTNGQSGTSTGIPDPSRPAQPSRSDVINSQLQANQERLRQDNAAQMGAQSGVDAVSGAQPNNSKAGRTNYSETDDGTWASERSKGIGVQTGRGLAEDLDARTSGRNYMYEPDTATPSQNPGGGLLGGLIAGARPGDNPTALSGGGDPGAGAGSGGAAAPAAPTVDTSAVASDPYQALIDQYAESSGQTIEDATKAINDIIAQLQDNLPNADGGRVGRVNTTEQENLLAQIVAAQQEQAKKRNDYAVQQGVDQLTRAMEDAAPQFQTMRNQAASAEAQALDNQALYAEARGDRGGIGAAQYASIQNTAAQNQLTVNREQTKLATDTARQIADLRAQGEFKKADELLSITQSYLSELMQLKQWADQANISIDEFNIGVQQWEQEYNSKIQQALAGMKMDAAQWSAGLNLDNDRDILNMTLSNMQTQENKNAKVAEQMIAAGVTPTDQQLAALGWNKDQYDAYKAAMAMAAAAGAGGGTKGNELYKQVQTLISGGVKNEIINDYIKNNSLSGLYSAEDIKATNGLWSGARKNNYQGKADYDVGG